MKQRKIAPKWKHLSNKRMAEKLTTGEAMDLSECHRDADGSYILVGPARLAAIAGAGIDFCDAKSERWMWSLGLMKGGLVRAATDSRYYLDDSGTVGKCLFLR